MISCFESYHATGFSVLDVGGRSAEEVDVFKKGQLGSATKLRDFYRDVAAMGVITELRGGVDYRLFFRKKQ